MGLKNLIAVGSATLAALYLLVNTHSAVALLVAFLIIVSAVLYVEYSETTQIPAQNRSVLITGCDTGFGHELAHYLESEGMFVFAGCLNKDSDGAERLRALDSDRLVILQLDVTNDEQVKIAVEIVKEQAPRGLWGLVNNAGLNFMGEAELSTIEQYRMCMDINYLGMVRMVKACLPLLRETKGRIVNVSSVKGVLSLPYNACYGSTKFAVESFSDILRMEVKKWQINVSIIQPGNFGGATGCTNMVRIRNDIKSMWENMDEDLQKLYGKEYLDAQAQGLEDSIPTACFNLYPVIEAMTDALLSTAPKKRYFIPGSKGFIEPYRWIAMLVPILPESVMDRLVMWHDGGNFTTAQFAKQQ